MRKVCSLQVAATLTCNGYGDKVHIYTFMYCSVYVYRLDDKNILLSTHLALRRLAHPALVQHILPSAYMQLCSCAGACGKQV